jgi:outer membrane receptor protein involved in Fe transport
MKIRSLSIAVLFLLIAGSLFAQVTTGQVEGTVKGPDGNGLPGVTVSATSPALMGERTTVTAAGGDYVLRALPPGQYTLKFSLEGMQPVTKKQNVALGLPTRSDATLSVSAITEAITVTGAAPTVLENTTVGANIKAEKVQQLPVVRTPTGIASLAGGVTGGDRGGRDGTPVGGQLSINGGIAYDNNFLVNGINVQDNIFGNTNNLFIEDAIQETQVLTSGISAEYGHFTGGVLNVITKSGGNEFTASARDNITKPGWLALTPYEEGFRGSAPAAKPAPHTGKHSNVYEATVGGPLMKDRIWFFLAGRDEKSATPQLAAVQGVAYNVNQTNKRPEVKLSGAITSGHSIQFDYINNPVKRDNEVQVTPIDFNAVGHNSTRVNHGWSGDYSGVLTSSLFGEARYSQKIFRFVGLGGTSTVINDSPMRSSSSAPAQTTGTFNAPYFDATDPEDRDNKQGYGALSYFLATQKMGSHDFKAGYEYFLDRRTGGNSQTATNYVFFTQYKTAVQGKDPTPVLDSAGHLIPIFIPFNGSNATLATFVNNWIATRGAKLDTTTDSFFVNDRWNLNANFTFNLGGRYEKVKTKATGGLTPVDTNNFTPRLGASYDPMGNGKYKFDVTYAQYAGRYNPALTGASTAVGNPAVLGGYYVGAAGEGRDFAPGFDPKNYVFYAARVPTANVFVSDGLHSPVSNEWTVSGGTQLPKNGWFKATFTDRKYTDFIQAFVDNPTPSGSTFVSLNGINVGLVDNIYYRNSNEPKRHYQAGEIQAHYDVTRNWGFEGNLTHQFKNDGNYEGESGQSIPTSSVGVRPEIQSPREIPVGHLAQYEENKLRLWSTYNFNMHRFGNLQAGVLYRYDSPLTFSYAATVPRSAASKALNPGYKSNVGSSSTITLFFGDRGIGKYNSTSLFDTSLQYSLPIASKVTPWIKFDTRNVFNKKTLVTYDTSVNAVASPVDALGYPLSFTPRTTFGNPVNNNSYSRPREYLVYVGVRY